MTAAQLTAVWRTERTFWPVLEGPTCTSRPCTVRRWTLLPLMVSKCLHSFGFALPTFIFSATSHRCSPVWVSFPVCVPVLQTGSSHSLWSQLSAITHYAYLGINNTQSVCVTNFRFFFLLICTHFCSLFYHLIPRNPLIASEHFSLYYDQKSGNYWH